MKRREFLKQLTTVGFGVSVCKFWPDNALATTNNFALSKRRLGRTDLYLSIIGFPGLALIRYSQAEVDREIRAVLDEGVNHFDVAPAYGDAEIKMGIAFRGINRDRYILSCKSRLRDAKGVEQELHRSLERLGTDYFDLYQIHSLRRIEEVKEICGVNGALEAITKAKDAGKIRYIGFSAHTVEAAMAALEIFPFDSVMFPINFIEIYRIGFGMQVLELAKKKGSGVIAIKPVAAGAWKPGQQRTRKHWYPCFESEREIELALKFALSLEPVTNAIPISFFDICRKCISIAKRYDKITPEEIKILQRMAQDYLSLFAAEELDLVQHYDSSTCLESLHG